MNSQSPFRQRYLQELQTLNDSIEPMKAMDDMNCIIEPTSQLGGVYLGNMDSASNRYLLLQNHIRAILTMCPQQIPITIKQTLLMQYNCCIEDMDSENIAQYFNKTFEFIEEARKVTNVLIHCQAGISRSATIVIAYLVRKNRIIVREAMELVRSKRWQIYPNNGFLRQLAEFERALFLPNEQEKQPKRVYENGKPPVNSINASKPIRGNMSLNSSIDSNFTIKQNRNAYGQIISNINCNPNMYNVTKVSEGRNINLTPNDSLKGPFQNRIQNLRDDVQKRTESFMSKSNGFNEIQTKTMFNDQIRISNENNLKINHSKKEFRQSEYSKPLEIESKTSQNWRKTEITRETTDNQSLQERKKQMMAFRPESAEQIKVYQNNNIPVSNQLDRKILQSPQRPFSKNEFMKDLEIYNLKKNDYLRERELLDKRYNMLVEESQKLFQSSYFDKQRHSYF